MGSKPPRSCDPRVVHSLQSMPASYCEVDVLLSRVIVGPLCSTIVNGGHVPIVTGGDQIAVCLGSLGLGLTPFSGAFERRADVSHFLHASANGGEVGIVLHPAGCGSVK